MPAPPAPPVSHSPPRAPAGDSDLGHTAVAPRSDTPGSPAPSTGGTEDADSGAEDETPAHTAFSFVEAMDRLASYTPDAVSMVHEAKAPQPCSVERLFNAHPASATRASFLKESCMVTDNLTRAQVHLRGKEAQEFVPGSVPDFPGALPPRKFFKPATPAFQKKPYMVHEIIPEAPLALTQEDLLLVRDRSRGQTQHVSLSERCLAEWEENARRGLVATSAMDSFLCGLASALKDPDQESFALRRSPDIPSIVAFIQAMAEGLKASSDAFTRAYLNAVIARRDAVLDASSVASSVSTKASLRAVPIQHGSLFGSHVQAILKHQADINRDLALHSRPSRPATKRPAPCTHSSWGLASALMDLHQESFAIRQSPDAATFVVFIQARAQGLKGSTEALTGSHLNAIMARQDAVLAASSVASSPLAKTEPLGPAVMPCSQMTGAFPFISKMRILISFYTQGTGRTSNLFGGAHSSSSGLFSWVAWVQSLVSKGHSRTQQAQGVHITHPPPQRTVYGCILIQVGGLCGPANSSGSMVTRPHFLSH